jgi:hypothetical protein
MNIPAFNALVAAAAMMLAAGCASTGAVSTIPYPDVGSYPPTDAARVQILRAEPARPHVQLAEITVDVSSSPPPTAQEVDGLLRSAAAKLGADAAVVVADSLQPRAGVASSSWWRGTTSGQGKVIAVAVRYR